MGGEGLPGEQQSHPGQEPFISLKPMEGSRVMLTAASGTALAPRKGDFLTKAKLGAPLGATYPFLSDYLA